MRTSGTGKEGMMTIIPVAMMVVFAMIITGGPNGLLKTMERTLASIIAWVVELMG